FSSGRTPASQFLLALTSIMNRMVIAPSGYRFGRASEQSPLNARPFKLPTSCSRSAGRQIDNGQIAFLTVCSLYLSAWSWHDVTNGSGALLRLLFIGLPSAPATAYSHRAPAATGHSVSLESKA